MLFSTFDRPQTNAMVNPAARSKAMLMVITPKELQTVRAEKGEEIAGRYLRFCAARNGGDNARA
jgi:hypothetical protein